MWIRSAFWIGSAKPDAGTRFRDGIDHVVVPALRALPGVRNANALWPERREDQPPQIACQVLVEFDNREDVDRMLASPERRAMREKVVELANLFDGAISHIEYRVG
jgi:antibiotic biosynthesis monooxygenase (ABM) superfamily enzyme